MSSYTMTLNECIQMWTDNQTYSIRDRIEKGRTKLFDFDYPIFDPAYKKIFETHFIRKFFMREIGFETEGLFKFNLETWLLINMPYFNKVFESEMLKFDPFVNTKMDVTNTKKKDQTGKTEGENNSSASNTSLGELVDDQFDRLIESNTPDSRLTLTAKDGEGVIQYASHIKENTDNSRKTSSGESNSTINDVTNVTNTLNETEQYIESRIGKTGTQTYSSMVNEYRNSLVRVENKIFDEMQDLFMLVY